MTLIKIISFTTMLMMILLGQHGHSCLGCRMMMIMMMTMTIMMMMMMMIVLLGEGGQARSRALRKTHSWAPLSSPASTQGHHHHHHHQHVLVMHGQDYEKFHASNIMFKCDQPKKLVATMISNALGMKVDPAH